jgi:NhaP-type Na+/H+ and K+/H+ antiporter
MMLLFKERPFVETLVLGIIFGVIYGITLILNRLTKIGNSNEPEFYFIYLLMKAIFTFYVAGWMLSGRSLLVMYLINVLIVKLYFYQKEGVWKIEDNLILFAVFAFPTIMQLMIYAKSILDGIILVAYTVGYAYNMRDALKTPFSGGL